MDVTKEYVLTDPWMPEKPKSKSIPNQQAHFLANNDMRVSGPRMDNPERWNLELLMNLLSDETVSNIYIIRVSQTNLADELIWCYNNSGQFSTKTFYVRDQRERFLSDNDTNFA